MGKPDPRHEAIRALMYRLRERDAAGPADRDAPEAFAAEFINALVGRGWRHQPALRPVQAERRGEPPPAATVHRYAAGVREDLRRAREGGGEVAQSA